MKLLRNKTRRYQNRHYFDIYIRRNQMHTKFKTVLKYSCLIFNIRYSTVNTVTKSCTSIKQRYSFARKLLRKQMLYPCLHYKMNDFDLTIPIMPPLCGSKKQTGHNF